MNVHRYHTTGGKDLIKTYIDNLPKDEKADGYSTLTSLEEDGLRALDYLETRQLRRKLWEIKFYADNRIMYVVADEDNIYLVHTCTKQKNRAEQFELEKAIRRVKELEQDLGKKFL